MPIIDPEFKGLIPPLGAEELEQLEESLRREGCRDALVLWQGVLIDGHHRLEICQRRKIEFRTIEISLESRTHARIWIRNNQRGRRNLTPAWIIELELGNKADLLEIGRAKKVEDGKATGRGNKNHLSQSDKTFHNTRTVIARAAGVSTGQVAMAEQVRTKAPDLWEGAKRGEISIHTAYNEIRKEEKQAAKTANLERARDSIAAQIREAGAASTIELADALDWLPSQAPSDLLLTDPPYMTDVSDIGAFARSWLPLALSKLKPTGRAYIFIGAYPEEIYAYMSVAMPAQILIWTYRNTLGPQPRYDYIRNLQAILYYKMPDAPPLDCPIIMEQISVQDFNHPARSAERLHTWQKPLELGEMFVRHSTKPGDVVLDPFACTGTFLVAAGRLGRIARGCEICEENLSIALSRGVMRA